MILFVTDLLCEFCPFKTVHPDSLKKHLGHRHGGDLPHHCHKCEKKFHKMYDLKLHIRDEHGNDLSYKVDTDTCT